MKKQKESKIIPWKDEWLMKERKEEWKSPNSFNTPMKYIWLYC